MMGTSTEAVLFLNISATTSAFALRGGKYDVVAKATGAGSMGLQIQAADGTFIAAHPAFVASPGFVTVDVPAGSYKFVIAGFTAVSATIASIPS
jgi:hypothetical protein